MPACYKYDLNSSLHQSSWLEYGGEMRRRQGKNQKEITACDLFFWGSDKFNLTEKKYPRRIFNTYSVCACALWQNEREHVWVSEREREMAARDVSEKEWGREMDEEWKEAWSTEVQEEGLCAFTLKSQSHIVLFLKRKSEGLAQALPWKPWINIRLPFCAYIIHHRMKPPNGEGFLALRHMKRQWNYPPMQEHAAKTDHWGSERKGTPGRKRRSAKKKRNLLVTWALW